MVGQFAKHRARDLLVSVLEWRGYLVQPMSVVERRQRSEFLLCSRDITRRHRAQTEACVDALAAKYAERPSFGTGRMVDFVRRLAECIDPLDVRLACTSQLTHALQVVEAMERDGIRDPEMLTVGLIHDIGKVLFLIGEPPEYIESNGAKTPLGDPRPGIGLMNCTFRWDHCDFAYLRLKESVAPHIAWLLRHHGIDVGACVRFMNARDREYMEKYLIPFAKYDDESKSAYHIPATRLERYEWLLDRAFPDPIAL